MRTETKRKADILIENRNILKGAFKTAGICRILLGASYAANQNKLIDIQRVHECRGYIRQASGRFSYFNSISSLELAVRLSFSEDYQAEFNNILNTYDDLKRTFKRSIFLPQLAVLFNDKPNAQELILRTEDIFSSMRKEHPWLTNISHITYAGLLALCEKDWRSMLIDAEDVFAMIKRRFFLAEPALLLSYVLAMYDAVPDVKAQNAMDFFSAFSQHRLKYGTVVELPTHGIFANACHGKDIGEAVSEIIEVYHYLLEHKGFGRFSLSIPHRLMLACMIVLDDDAGRINALPFNELFSQLYTTFSIIVCSQQGD